MADLPANVIASETAKGYGVMPSGTTDSDTNPVVGPTKIPGPGTMPSGSQAVPTGGPALSPSGPQASTGASPQPKPSQTSVSAAAVSSDGSSSVATASPSVSAFSHQGNTMQSVGPPSESSDGGDAVTDVVYKTVTVNQ